MKQVAGIWLPDGETHLVKHLAESPRVHGAGTYQLNKIRLAMRYTKAWRVAIDIGAHVGTHARILSLQFDHVYAFEPVADYRDCFIRNVTARNVTLHSCALGDKNSTVRMFSSAGNSGHSYVADCGQPVPLETLDSFDLRDVDFVKIDTEGYERHIVEGGLETIRTWKPTMMVEQKSQNGSRYGYGDHGAIELLQRMGATVAAINHGDYVMVW